jgi:hypothetical protein
MSTCDTCIASSTLTEGAVSRSECYVCDEGYYGDPTQNQTCQQCADTEGLQCPAGSKIPYFLSGYSRVGTIGVSLAAVIECSPLEACKETGSSVETTCGTGYSGPRCGDCASGYYHYGRKCKGCPSQISSWMAFIVLLVLVAFIVLRFLRNEGKFPTDARIAIQGIQFLSIYPAIASQWPTLLLSLFEFASFSVSFPI